MHQTLEVNDECGLANQNMKKLYSFLRKKQNINHYMNSKMAAIKNDK